jgi:hypothetical protein
MTESGHYVCYYRDSGKNYININGDKNYINDDMERDDQYDVYYNLQLAESGHYAYSYIGDDEKWHLRIRCKNGAESEKPDRY